MRENLQALAYYYMRTLVYRPAVGSSLGQKAAPALISIGEASKHIVQIVQLLEERNMTFSFCLNKTDTLVICGMTLLYQTLDLKQDSKLSKDSQKFVNAVIQLLVKAQAPGSLDFKRIAGMIIAVDDGGSPTQSRASPPTASTGHTQRRSPSTSSHARSATPQDAKPSLGRLAGASASETDLLQQQAKLRRMTMPSAAAGRPEVLRPQSRRSIDNPQTQSFNQREHRLSMSHSPQTSPSQHGLDYLALNPGSPAQGHMPVSMQGRRQHNLPSHLQQRLSQMHPGAQVDSKPVDLSSSQWEALLGSLDGGQSNVYDAIYGGAPLSLNDTAAIPTNGGVSATWLADAWELNTFNLGDFDGSVATQSVLSISDEGLSPGEEMTPTDLGLSVGSLDIQGTMISNQCSNGEGYLHGMGNDYII